MFKMKKKKKKGNQRFTDFWISGEKKVVRLVRDY